MVVATVTTPDHLGGHLGMTWIDTPTLGYLVRRYEVRSMLDVGCGPGGMIEAAASRGIQATGIDGDPSVAEGNQRIVCHDYTTGALRWRPVDLIWCVEFVEHVEAKYAANYLATFDAGRVLFLTAAYPVQGGHHHVNEQPGQYWVQLLDNRGWKLDDEATLWVRGNSGMPFGRMTGMVFVKTAR